MRRIVAVDLLSADGYFSAENPNDYEWFSAFPEFAAFNAKEVQRFDTLMYGRVSYEGFLGYWPAALHDPHLPEEAKALAHKMNGMGRIVFSRTLESDPQDGTRVLHDIVPDEIRELKAGPGGDIVIYGSGSIVGRLTGSGLIDEYVLAVLPTFLGRGRTLTAGIGPRVELELVGSQAYPSGTVVHRYVRRDGTRSLRA